MSLRKTIIVVGFVCYAVGLVIAEKIPLELPKLDEPVTSVVSEIFFFNTQV